MKHTQAILASLLLASTLFTSIGAAQNATLQYTDEDFKAVSAKVKAEAPVLFIGDSMMAILGKQGERIFKRSRITPVAQFSSLGSGLCRPSVFNWHNKIDELTKAHSPKTVIISLGCNDRQPLETKEGEVILYTDAEKWIPAYGEIISSVNDKLIEAKVQNIIWLLPPDMQKSETQEHAQLVRKIIIADAVKENHKGNVRVFDLVPLLSSTPGTYTRYKMSPNGKALPVRDPDGIHLAVDGARLIAQTLIDTYFKD